MVEWQQKLNSLTMLKTHQKHIKKTTFSDVFLLCFASENPPDFLNKGANNESIFDLLYQVGKSGHQSPDAEQKSKASLTSHF